jgi:hypothetical protein
MVILTVGLPERRRLVVAWFRPEGRVPGPVEKELAAQTGATEFRTIEKRLRDLQRLGFEAPGLRVEKVKSSRARLFELKLTVESSGHRFLGVFAPGRTAEGLPVLILVKYVKKKRQKLDRKDIETAENRAARLA